MEIDKIYTGDCLEIMRSFPDKSFDLCLTDPPYNAKNIGPNKKDIFIGADAIVDYRVQEILPCMV